MSTASLHVALFEAKLELTWGALNKQGKGHEGGSALAQGTA